MDSECSYWVGHFAHGIDTGAVEIPSVFSRFDEEIVLNVSFHLFPRGNEVIFASVHFFLAFRPTGIWTERDEEENPKRERERERTRNTIGEFLGTIAEQLIIEKFFKRAKDDHGPSVIDWKKRRSVGGWVRVVGVTFVLRDELVGGNWFEIVGFIIGFVSWLSLFSLPALAEQTEFLLLLLLAIESVTLNNERACSSPSLRAVVVTYSAVASRVEIHSFLPRALFLLHARLRRNDS